MIVNLKKLDEFSVGILQTLVKLVQVEILKLMTCCATGTGMVVKTALTTNETKVSSSGFIEICLIFWMKSVLSLTKDEVFAIEILKNFSDEFCSVVCCCATS